MGTWGSDIFDDDFTLDIKDYLSQFKAEAVSVNQCISRLKRLYQEVENDPDLKTLFYVGLAGALCEHGALTEEIRRETLAQIACNRGLARWKEAGLIPFLKRKYVLNRFCHSLKKQKCITDCTAIDEEDLQSERFCPDNQVYHVYKLSLASGKTFIGSTAHLEERKRYFRENPIR